MRGDAHARFRTWPISEVAPTVPWLTPEAVRLAAKVAKKPTPLNLIGKLNRRFSSPHNVAALSSSQWSLKLEVIYERR
jgi:hypothetical protein